MAQPQTTSSSQTKGPNFIRDFFRRVNQSQETPLEKGVSYLLFSLSLATPGIHLKGWFNAGNRRGRALTVEIYVFCKVLLCVLAAIFGWYRSKDGSENFLYCLIVWFTLETILYNLLQILCNNLFTQLNSIKRNIILAFFNYLEIIFSFSIFYATNDLVRQSCHPEDQAHFGWIDYVYFSIGSGGVLGYGDYAIYSDSGKILAMGECLTLLMFFALFIGYNINLFANARSSS